MSALYKLKVVLCVSMMGITKNIPNDYPTSFGKKERALPLPAWPIKRQDDFFSSKSQGARMNQRALLFNMPKDAIAWSKSMAKGIGYSDIRGVEITEENPLQHIVSDCFC